ncbi:MAG: thioesterase [Acidobacteria bacterium]|nr:MAG: thioesterase [Acidobacteriota bacterium]
MEDHFRKLENMYLAAPVNDHFAPELKISNGSSILTMEVNPRFFHAANALHGSVYFKALDDSAFFAVSSLVREFFVVTVSFNVFLLRPVTKGTLRCEGTVTSSSKNLFIAESVLYLDGGNQVARGSGSFMVSRTRLSDVESYR